MSARLVPEHFKRGGRPKRKFATPEAAWAFVDLKNQRGKVKVYRCGFCGSWHLATKR